MKLNSEEIREIAAEKTKEFGEDVLSVSKQAVFGIAEMLGEAAARYKIYVEQENAKAAYAAQQHRMCIILNTLNGHYTVIADLLREAINNMSPLTNMVFVAAPDKLYVEIEKRYGKNRSDGTTGFRYIALGRSRTITAGNVERILQNELNRLCAIHGFPRLKIGVVSSPTGLYTLWLSYMNQFRVVGALI